MFYITYFNHRYNLLTLNLYAWHDMIVVRVNIGFVSFMFIFLFSVLETSAFFFGSQVRKPFLSRHKQFISTRVMGKKKQVIVLAGPTAVGKTDVAAALAEKLNGMVISADSVQAYTGVQIGANKPSPTELEQTPHLLIDIASHDENYNVAEWRRDAIYCIQSLLNDKADGNETEVQYEQESEEGTCDQRRRLIIDKAIQDARKVKNYGQSDTIQPIVVGGTMMYIQWLVHGRPDALRPTGSALEKALEIVTDFKRKDDWTGALEFAKSLGDIYEKQTTSLCGEDWYRLRRIIEVAYTVKESNGSISASDVYNRKRERSLPSFDYDVRCFFLCPSDRMQHARIIDERCERMIQKGLLQETCELEINRMLPEMAEKAIGYRQVLDYLRRENPRSLDSETFASFFENFSTATRRYAKKQMQWFRKDSQFFFVPVDLSISSDERIRSSSSLILDACELGVEEFQTALSDPNGVSALTRQSNEKQGKGMKVYAQRRKVLLEGSQELEEALRTSDICTDRLVAKKTRLV